MFISDLLEENNDTLTEFIFDIKNILETNGEDWGDYVTFLNDNNISIFCPIPLEDYNDVEFPTVVPEPINNYNVSMGYEFQYPEFKIVPVNDISAAIPINYKNIDPFKAIDADAN